MSDLYYEHLVKKERTTKDTLLKFGMIFFTVLFVVAGLFISFIFLVPALVLIIADYFVLPKTDLEYEYLFVNGEIDVDMVMSKTKRKRVKSFNIKDADMVAPLKSHRLDYHNNNQKIKVLDYSSGNPEHLRFAVITRDGTEAAKIIIEPDEMMARKMKDCAPSKVFLD